jgi:hypothetical protein
MFEDRVKLLPRRPPAPLVTPAIPTVPHTEWEAHRRLMTAGQGDWMPAAIHLLFINGGPGSCPSEHQTTRGVCLPSGVRPRS